MLSEDATQLSEEHAEFAANIRSSAQHLLSLINDVLDLARIESGKMQVQIGVVDYPSLIDESISAVSPLASAKAMRIESSIDERLGEGTSDGRLVSQILLNYLSNAIKFTPAGGHVRVMTAPVDESSLRIDVADDGPGIARYDLDELFAEFVRAPEAERLREGSTGLGLSLTKKLAESLGGRVEAQSERGVGSVFSVILPFNVDAQAA